MLWSDVEQEYRESTPESERYVHETKQHVPAGAASTFRMWDPYAPVMDRAEGVYLYDLDDNEYLDFGFTNGAGMVGHTHEAVREAIHDQVDAGTMYGFPNSLLSEAAQQLKERWETVDLVRFTNSGTESTMHAIRIARAYSNRDTVLKIEGAYHGQHDYLLHSLNNTTAGEWGHRQRPARVPASEGMPDEVGHTVEVAQFNDLDSVEAVLEENRNEIAAVIVEPIILGLGVLQPRDGFLQGLRELCDEYNVVYIFDEVKTGVKIAPGGAAEYYDVEPDLVTLAKSIGGNYPVGAFGGREEIMRTIEGGAAHQGTYNGNPLVLRALVTVLRDVLTEAAYDHAYEMGARLAEGYEDVMEDAGLAGHVDAVTTQGSAFFTDSEFVDYRDFVEHVDPELQENYWFAMFNRGVIPQPHSPGQQWTISVQHTEEHVEEHLEAFKDVAPRLAAEQS